MSLNTETLNTILAPYIRSLTDGETAEMAFGKHQLLWHKTGISTRWISCHVCPGHTAGPCVMDTPVLQPIGGMQALMIRPTEVELVRECFSLAVQ